MELDFQDSLIVAMCNIDEGKTAEEVSSKLSMSKNTVAKKLSDMREYGYVVAEPEKQESGHEAYCYRIKPKAYNEALDVLRNYMKVTVEGLKLLQKDGFEGHHVGGRKSKV